MDLNGLVLIDKPRGWTSFDVVAKVRGLARRAIVAEAALPGSVYSQKGRSIPKRVKVGHTGTLDPLATGLLVILVGTYTKRAPALTKLDKTYEVEMKLGEVSTTGDEEGDKSLSGDKRPDIAAVKSALGQFIGDIMQTPPAYSAIKVNGVRAYKLAREGKEVVMQARPARVDSLVLTGYEYPFVKFTSDVSSGTYIRSLVEDLGRELGTGAYMSGLRRTRVGQFKLDDARSIEGLVLNGIGPADLIAMPGL